jgi:hypothetical protein
LGHSERDAASSKATGIVLLGDKSQVDKHEGSK